MLVFDITSRESFEHIKDKMEEIRSQTSPNTIKALVGNKIDKKAESVNKITSEL